jgi:hypothetical protein
VSESGEPLNLHDTSEVIHASDVREVNNFLKAGWFIIDTYKHEYQPGSTVLMYALGWLRSKGAPIKPKYDELGDLFLDE